MNRVTIVFGILLAVLGVGSFVATGSSHPTALIPLWFGLVLMLCGILASSTDAKKRMLWMHIAVTAALLGFIFPAVRVVMAAAKVSWNLPAVPHKGAIHEQIAMAALCLVFVVLCVRSFIAARRSGVV